jgi:hypothetical protein
MTKPYIVERQTRRELRTLHDRGTRSIVGEFATREEGEAFAALCRKSETDDRFEYLVCRYQKTTPAWNRRRPLGKG